MIESILLDEPEQQRKKQQGSGRYQWIAFMAFSVLLALGAVALVMSLDKSKNDAPNPPKSFPPVLTSPNAAEMCDSCTLIPNMEDHVMCKSCTFAQDESKSLLCPSGYGDLTLNKLLIDGHSNAAAFAAVQNECTDQYANYLEDSGEAFGCTFTLDELLGTEPAPEEIEYVYDETADEGVVDEAGTGEGTDEPVLEAAEAHSHHHHHHYHSHFGHHEEGILIKYVCHATVEVESYSEAEQIEQLRLRSPAPFKITEPFLSSTQVKCDKRKALADTLEKVKICDASGSAPITFSCPTGSDPRMIVAKMKALSGPLITNNDNKMRMKKAMNFCAAGNMIDGECTISPEDLLLDFETSLDGYTWNIAYFCSYGESITQEVQLQSALQLLEGSSGEPSEPLLSSALVKCGNRKEFASTVEVAKVCSDQDFELTCDANQADARIIVLGMWTGGQNQKEAKIAKQRARAATNFCAGENFVNGVCTFSLSELGVDIIPEEPLVEDGSSVLEETSMSVKYLCSYSTPI